MKMNRRSFKFNPQTTELIKQLFTKLTRGPFRIDRVEWSSGSGTEDPTLTVKLNSATGVSPEGLKTDPTGETPSSSGTNPERDMTPDEKEIQEQVASCYL